MRSGPCGLVATEEEELGARRWGEHEERQKERDRLRCEPTRKPLKQTPLK